MGKWYRGWVVLASLVALGPLQAADIYRWVDEQGRTHLSDVVPERYRDSATRTDARRYELTPEQQHEANDRSTQERLRDAAVNPAASTSPAAPTATMEAPVPPVKRPAERVTAATSCANWWRLYRESEECFGPFRSVGGGVKPEAFDHCNEIPSPETRCGPYRD
jgi:Domain of unknown function (DUF4124)